MENIIKGRVWKLGDAVDTDVITPTKYLSLPHEEMKDHALEPVLPNFAAEVKPGDVIIAGKNFGCGSSRETAVTALVSLKVGAVVARSFARIFFRNAIARGLPILTLDQARELFDQGDSIEVDVEKGLVRNPDKSLEVKAKPLSEDMLEMLRKGGILALLKERMSQPG